MVGPLKLTQFYGHSVPRPRIYADVKFNDHRVDPPPSVNDALLSWANDAPWSMGGLAHRRLRAQGKLEGSARKLRSLLEDEDEELQQPEKPVKSPPSDSKIELSSKQDVSHLVDDEDEDEDDVVVLATPALKMKKRNRDGYGSTQTPPASVLDETPDRVSKKRRGKASLAEKVSSSPGPLTRKGSQSPGPLTRKGSQSPGPLTRKGSQSPSLSANDLECDEDRLTRSAKRSKRSGGTGTGSESDMVSRSAKKAASIEAERSSGKGAARRLLSKVYAEGKSEEGEGSNGESEDEIEAKQEGERSVVRRSRRSKGTLSLS